MDPKFSATFKAALNLWLSGAMGQIDGHPEEIGELRKCMEGDGEVRICYNVKGNYITLEALNHAERTVAELFREQLVSDDKSLLKDVVK
jgi:hypothetical protein